MYLKFFFSLVLLTYCNFSLPQKPIRMQVFSGPAKINIINNQVFINNGIDFFPANTHIVLGVENHLFTSTKKHEWPGIDFYRFRRTTDVLSFSFGVNILKDRLVNPYLGLILNNSFYFGKLKTDNEQLKNYITNSYYYRTSNFFLLLKLNIRLTERLALYISQNAITLRKREYIGMTSIGIGYNFLEKE